MLRRQYLPIVLILLFCGLLYGPGLNGPFLFDSKVALHSNPDVQISGSQLEEWRIALLSSNSGPLGRPISMLSFAANYVVAEGLDGFSFKLVNLLLHLGNGLLLWFVLNALLTLSPQQNIFGDKTTLIVTAVSALWLLHPLHISTVLYTVQRMTQLAMMFNLLGLWLFLYYRQQWLVAKPAFVEICSQILNLTLITLAAGFCKENGLLLPWLLILVEVFFFNYLIAGKKSQLLKYVCCLSFILPVLGILLLLAVGNDFLSDWYQARDFTAIERLYTQLRVLWQYLAWIVLPDFRAMGLHHDDIALSSGLLSSITTLLALLAWLVLITVVWLYRHKWPILAFSVAWFVVAHSMESSIIPLEIAYEHRNYLPSVGIIFGLVTGCYWCLRHNTKLAWAMLVVFGLLCSVQLYVRSTDWSNELRMASVNMHYHPESPRSAYHYANTLLRLAENSSSEESKKRYMLSSRDAYKKILDIDDDNVAALVTLIYIEARYFPALVSKRWQQQLQKTVVTKNFSPADFNSLKLLASCFSAGYCRSQATDFEFVINTLISRYADRADLYDLKAQYCGFVLKDYDCAIVESHRALAVSPNYFFGYYTLITWYVNKGDHGNTLKTVAALAGEDRKRQESIDIRSLFNPDNR